MKITFLLPCCIAKFIEDMIMNRRKRKRVLLWSSVIAMVIVVLAVMTVREMLLASSFLCTTSDVINNHISVLVCPCRVTFYCLFILNFHKELNLLFLIFSW